MSEFQSYIGIKHIKAKPADERAVDYAALKKSIDAADAENLFDLGSEAVRGMMEEHYPALK